MLSCAPPPPTHTHTHHPTLRAPLQRQAAEAMSQLAEASAQAQAMMEQLAAERERSALLEVGAAWPATHCLRPLPARQRPQPHLATRRPPGRPCSSRWGGTLVKHARPFALPLSQLWRAAASPALHACPAHRPWRLHRRKSSCTRSTTWL